jgi:hypothetical protein
MLLLLTEMGVFLDIDLLYQVRLIDFFGAKIAFHHLETPELQEVLL